METTQTTVADLKSEAMGDILEERKDRITHYLKEKLEVIENKNKCLSKLTKEIKELNAKLSEFSALSIEDAITKLDEMSQLTSGNSTQWVLTGNGFNYINC